MFKKFFNRKPVPVCPFDTNSAPYEAIEIASNRPGVPPVEIPRTCLEFLEIPEYVRLKGKPTPDRTFWFNVEESAKIREHEHARVNVSL